MTFRRKQSFEFCNLIYMFPVQLIVLFNFVAGITSFFSSGFLQNVNMLLVVLFFFSSFFIVILMKPKRENIYVCLVFVDFVHV